MNAMKNKEPDLTGVTRERVAAWVRHVNEWEGIKTRLRGWIDLHYLSFHHNKFFGRTDVAKLAKILEDVSLFYEDLKETSRQCDERLQK